jgi:hypothetical protein
MISAAILSKIGIPAAFVAAGFIGGLTFQAKVLDKKCPTLECPKVEVPKCPDCNCPPTLGNEFDKIKTKGKSNLTLNLHNHYTVSGMDSSNLRLTIKESVEAALKDYGVKKKR